MADDLLILPQPLQRPTAKPASQSVQGQAGTPGPSFDSLLNQQLQGNGLRFSKHASLRMQSRGIQFNAKDLGRLDQAVRQAGAKGCRDSLVLLDSTALVVSIKDHTVITVTDKEQLKGNLFTNIDSAIIA